MELNLQEIERANKRVSAALNRRYEKNAELFISRQDVEDVKQWLYSGQFSYVYSKFKADGIHPDIYFLTILKNSWLIQSIDKQQFYDFIMPILKQVRPYYAKTYLREVADRKMDVPELLRAELLKYYMQTLSYEEIKTILAKGEAIGVVRLRLLVARLLEEHVGTEAFINVFTQYEIQYPEIRGDNYFLASIAVPEALQRKHMDILVNWINAQAMEKQVSQYFLNGLQFNSELLYEYAIEQAKQHIHHTEKRKVWFKQIAVAANKLMRPKTADTRRKQMTKEIIQLYVYLFEHFQKESPHYIRYCFKRIHHQEFREQLNMFFTEQRIQLVDPRFREDLNAALTGKNSDKITTIAELAREIEQNAWNPRFMAYLAFQFIDMRPKQNHWIDLFDRLTYGSNRISLFISTVLKIAGTRPEIWQSYFQAVQHCKLTEQYAIDVIVQNAPNNPVAKQYLEHHDYQKYSEIYRV